MLRRIQNHFAPMGVCLNVVHQKGTHGYTSDAPSIIIESVSSDMLTLF